MTATAKQIDWNKPVQATQAIPQDNKSWWPVRVLCTDRCEREGTHPILVLVDFNGDERIDCVRKNGDSFHWQFRNTPAPPVPFERNRYMNVRRLNDGSLDISPDTYGTCETAMMYARHGFVTVPVTIRGEWPGEEVQGG